LLVEIISEIRLSELLEKGFLQEIDIAEDNYMFLEAMDLKAK
jgi:hypothetical protein